MDSFKKKLIYPLVIVITSVVLVILSTYPGFLLARNGLLIKGGLGFLYLIDFSALLIMFLIPVLIIKFIFKRPLVEFGICLPKNRGKALKLTVFGVLVLLPILFIFAKQQSFQNFYDIKEGFSTFFLLATLGSGVYYIGEEFLFRGFMFFSLSEKVRLHSFWIISLVFALLHATKPTGEIFFAFISSIVFCYLSLKTRSFLPAFAVHFTIAIALNLIVMFHF